MAYTPHHWILTEAGQAWATSTAACERNLRLDPRNAGVDDTKFAENKRGPQPPTKDEERKGICRGEERRQRSLRAIWWFLMFLCFCVCVVFNPYIASRFPALSQLLRDRIEASRLSANSSLIGDAFSRSQQETVEGQPPEEGRRPAMRKGIKYYRWSHAVSSHIQKQHPPTIYFLFYDENVDAVGQNSIEGRQRSQSGEPVRTPVADGADPTGQLLSAFQDVAVDFSSQPVVHVSVTKSLMHHWSYILPEGSENLLPLAVIVEMDKGWRKYILRDKHLTYTKLKNFEEQYFRGTLTPYLRSESPAAVDTEMHDVIVPLVGNTFRRHVVDSKYDALVLFYAPWCGFCKRLEPQIRALATEFSRIRSIRFFKMDVTKNDIDHPQTRVERVPHVVLYQRERKMERPIRFDHSVKDTVGYGKDFLLEHATCKHIKLEENKDCDFGDTPSHEF